MGTIEEQIRETRAEMARLSGKAKHIAEHKLAWLRGEQAREEAKRGASVLAAAEALGAAVRAGGDTAPTVGQFCDAIGGEAGTWLRDRVENRNELSETVREAHDVLTRAGVPTGPNVLLRARIGVLVGERDQARAAVAKLNAAMIETNTELTKAGALPGESTADRVKKLAQTMPTPKDVADLLIEHDKIHTRLDQAGVARWTGCAASWRVDQLCLLHASALARIELGRYELGLRHGTLLAKPSNLIAQVPIDDLARAVWKAHDGRETWAELMVEYNAEDEDERPSHLVAICRREAEAVRTVLVKALEQHAAEQRKDAPDPATAFGHLEAHCVTGPVELRAAWNEFVVAREAENDEREDEARVAGLWEALDLLGVPQEQRNTIHSHPALQAMIKGLAPDITREERAQHREHVLALAALTRQVRAVERSMGNLVTLGAALGDLFKMARGETTEGAVLAPDAARSWAKRLIGNGSIGVRAIEMFVEEALIAASRGNYPLAAAPVWNYAAPMVKPDDPNITPGTEPDPGAKPKTTEDLQAEIDLLEKRASRHDRDLGFVRRSLSEMLEQRSEKPHTDTAELLKQLGHLLSRIERERDALRKAALGVIEAHIQAGPVGDSPTPQDIAVAALSQAMDRPRGATT